MSQSLRVSRINFAAFVDTILWRSLRAAGSMREHSPWLAAQLRRCVLILWWTFTLQLHTHARYWLRARRLRRIAPTTPAEPLIATVDPNMLFVPLSDDPLVSVIVPTFGQTDFTLRCLSSIMQNAPEVPIEVIVVDDAWTGADAAFLDRVRGIRLIRNDRNLGYLRSCNKAAEAARGRYLYLLNNDTQVLPGWLEPMLSLLTRRQDVGAVGAKLLYPNGRLQEAGGIIWRDASGWNFGRHEDADLPVYNYVREVDYCSAAALLVDRAVFLGMGGFDERYVPAYFEDSDLCFRLRRMGLKTLYQPAARVVHFEGISHGRDVAIGIKSYQVANRRRFVEAWGTVLATQHFPNGQNVFRARDRAMHRQVVLVVDHFVPQPDRDAGSRTMMGFLRVLVRAGLVVKFWPHNLSYSPGYTEVLQDMGIEVFHGPSQVPFAAWIKEFGSELDCILLSRPEVAEDVIPSIRQHSRARLVYYGHDLHFRRMHRQGEMMADERLLRSADRMETCERAIWRQVDLSLYPSEEEADIASALQPDCRFQPVVPYGFESFPVVRDVPSGLEIIFVAGFGHPPNEDAAIWFTAEVMPLIRQQVPGAYLSIIGSNPTIGVGALANEAVSIFANVSDGELAAAYGRARVAVVPLRCGAGVKLKVVEALREGVPLVTTPVGAQGLPGIWQVVAVQDDPMRFAAAVVTLLLDDAAWAEGSSAQLAFAARRFSVDAVQASLLAVLDVPVEESQECAA
ncbi:glycosyltransferase [Rhodopila sp.]|uniref:glycosyltransferase n=1 Tax=Rhodopila sp. TaxID=2480087 RepID=UPI003D11EA51